MEYEVNTELLKNLKCCMLYENTMVRKNHYPFYADKVVRKNLISYPTSLFPEAAGYQEMFPLVRENQNQRFRCKSETLRSSVPRIAGQIQISLSNC